jgi:hypothetical protein
MAEKFKVGDMIVANKTSDCCAYIKGKIYKIDSLVRNSMNFQSLDSKGKPNGWLLTYFSKYEPTKLEKVLYNINKEEK